MLQISYHEQTGPGTAHYTAVGLPLSWDRELEPGQLASERVVEVAQQFAADALQYLGIAVDYSTDPADYPPTPEPEPVDDVLQLYLDRAGPYAGPAQRVIARWAAYNHVQLASEREGWTQEAIAGLLATPRCQGVVAALTTFGWGLAASLLSAASTEDHPLATPDVIEAYLAAMGAEGALP